MTRDEAIEALVDGKCIKQEFWGNAYLKIVDGKLLKFSEGKINVEKGHPREWSNSGWVIFPQIDKYEAIKILFDGGRIKFNGRVYCVGDVKGWSPFHKWEEFGYEQV